MWVHVLVGHLLDTGLPLGINGRVWIQTNQPRGAISGDSHCSNSDFLLTLWPSLEAKFSDTIGNLFHLTVISISLERGSDFLDQLINGSANKEVVDSSLKGVRA
jgi:hypothetical protein